jgi:predicted lysophospholipase L1 biosynthesis ABC-type transport system permease subunit
MGAALPDPGQRVTLGDPPPTGQANLLPQWTIPAGIKPARTGRSPSGLTFAGLAATPGAIDAGLLRQPNMQAYLTLAAIDPDAVDQVRNTAAGIDPLSSVQELSSTSQAQDFTSIQHGLFIGVVATLLLIGASLLVGMLEQLRERRRVLAALVAFGTRRGTLSASVLWQSAVPMLLGLALAIVAGIGLGAVLLAMVGEPIQLDWKGIGAIAGAAGAVVLLVTLLSLPALWRLTRPDGLRTE